MKFRTYAVLVGALVLSAQYLTVDISSGQGCRGGDVEIERTKTYVRCKPGPKKIACITQAGNALKTEMNKCQAIGTTCLVESDLDDKAAACAAGHFFASAGTTAAIATAPTPPTTAVVLLTLGASLTNCAIQARSAEKAMIRCEDKMDACRGTQLDRHKKAVATCNK